MWYTEAMKDKNGNEYGVVKGKQNFQPIQDEFSDIPEAWRRWDLRHPEGRKAKQKKWWAENRDYKVRWNKAKWAIVRKLVFDHYGWRCACCGETTEDFLTIDHINGGGSKHQDHVHSVYGWIVNHNFPEEFQTLCYNCNCARSKRGRNGICPHAEIDYSDRYGFG